MVNGDSTGCPSYDACDLLHTLDIWLAGIEVYDILRYEYDIQVEFGGIENILANISVEASIYYIK